MFRHQISLSPFLSSSSRIQHTYIAKQLHSHPNLKIIVMKLLRKSAMFYFRKYTTLNAIYPPCVEPEARNSAVGWH